MPWNAENPSTYYPKQCRKSRTDLRLHHARWLGGSAVQAGLTSSFVSLRPVRASQARSVPRLPPPRKRVPQVQSWHPSARRCRRARPRRQCDRPWVAFGPTLRARAVSGFAIARTLFEQRAARGRFSGFGFASPLTAPRGRCDYAARTGQMYDSPFGSFWTRGID